MSLTLPEPRYGLVARKVSKERKSIPGQDGSKLRQSSDEKNNDLMNWRNTQKEEEEQKKLDDLLNDIRGEKTLMTSQPSIRNLKPTMKK